MPGYLDHQDDFVIKLKPSREGLKAMFARHHHNWLSFTGCNNNLKALTASDLGKQQKNLPIRDYFPYYKNILAYILILLSSDSFIL